MIPTSKPTLLEEFGTLQELLKWYEINLCNTRLIDPRGFRVRFVSDDLVHFIKLKTKHGQEPRNRALALEAIRRGEIRFVRGRFDEDRASGLLSAATVATQPDVICTNWQTLGIGSEAYIKDFGRRGDFHAYRVLICKVVGTVRQAVTLFPRESIGEKELRSRIWPK